jgi:hypothetical protein
LVLGGFCWVSWRYGDAGAIIFASPFWFMFIVSMTRVLIDHHFEVRVGEGKISWDRYIPGLTRTYSIDEVVGLVIDVRAGRFYLTLRGGPRRPFLHGLEREEREAIVQAITDEKGDLTLEYIDEGYGS